MNTYAPDTRATRPLRVCLCRGCDAVLAHPHPDTALCERCADEVAALACPSQPPRPPSTPGWCGAVPVTPGFAGLCALAVCVGWLIGRRLGAALS